MGSYSFLWVLMGSFHQPQSFSPWPGLSLGNVVQDSDTAPVPVESEETKREMDKIGFPVAEGDLSPGAMVPKACQAIHRQINKLEAMIEACKGVDRLTPLQERSLVKLQCVGPIHPNWAVNGKLIGHKEDITHVFVISQVSYVWGQFYCNIFKPQLVDQSLLPSLSVSG